jgi:peptide-methionine (R)-S-oxide reductase
MDIFAQKSDSDWRNQLTPEQYRICSQCVTEPPYTGKYGNSHDEGICHCVCCGTALFDSSKRLDSGSGWRSYWQTRCAEAVTACTDCSRAMTRAEATCAHCGADLGNVFEDGPPPTGLRYYINSVALILEKAKS